MGIDALQQIAGFQTLAAADMSPTVHAPSPGQTFASLLENELSGADSKIGKAEEMVRQLATGKAENIHQVMIAIQEANLSFELMVQVRNRLLDGYQDIIKMQV